MINKQPPQPVQLNPDQLGVKNRNLMIEVMDTLGCSKREALMYMASLKALEEKHPEYKIGQLPPKMLLQVMKQIRDKLMDQHNLEQTLKGPQQDANNLDSLLGSNK